MKSSRNEIIALYGMCGVELRGGKFYDRKTDNLSNGLKVGYQKKLGGLFGKSPKRAEIEFDNGVQDGVMILWFENGQKWLEMEYDNGIPSNWRRRWYKDGQLEEESRFENGKIVERKHHPNDEVLAMYLIIYRKRIEEFAMPTTAIREKASIESFLQHELAFGEEKIRQGNENYAPSVVMLKDHREEILNYILKNL